MIEVEGGEVVGVHVVVLVEVERVTQVRHVGIFFGIVKLGTIAPLKRPEIRKIHVRVQIGIPHPPTEDDVHPADIAVFRGVCPGRGEVHDPVVINISDNAAPASCPAHDHREAGRAIALRNFNDAAGTDIRSAVDCV